MSGTNTHNNTTTITQLRDQPHMSVLGTGAGCWYPSPSPSTQLPPTAPLRQKRQSTPSHQAMSVHHMMQQLQQGGAGPTHYPGPGPAPLSLPPSARDGTPHQPMLSPNSMQTHINHHNPHVSMASSGMHPMSTSAQGALLASHQAATNGAMTTSLHCMPGLHQQPAHLVQHHPQQVLNLNASTQQQQQVQNPSSIMMQPQQTSQPVDINSIQQGLPQALRSAKAPDITRSSHTPWHHGKITRDRAEQLLHPRSDGLFLVRESTNFPGDQTLCVCFQGRVEHYRIKCGAKSTLTIDDEEFFDTLPDLINHYLQDADGLCTQLVKCLPKKPHIMTTTTTQTTLPQNNQQPQVHQQQKSALQQQQQMIQQQLQQNQMLQQGHSIIQQGQMMQDQMLQQQGQMLQQSQMHQQPQMTQQPQVLQHPNSQQPPQNNDHNMSSYSAPQAFVEAGWMISERDLEIRENIGKGEFGDVMLGILNGQRVAVKMLKDSEAASKFLAEATLMTSLKHENLVKLLGLVFNKQHICLVTEYMSKGSLVDYLRSRGRLHVTKRDQIMFAFDTCSGMEYLEQRRVVHRDLAARNVLVSDTGLAKVADFGLAREEGGPDAAAKLPIKWTAPEALKHNKFSNKSDMWSFGILLWEIYSFGRVPYPRIPLADVVKHVEKGYKMEAPEGCPPELYELMRQAWDLNPDTRPTFNQAKTKLAVLKANTPVT